MHILGFIIVSVALLVVSRNQKYISTPTLIGSIETNRYPNDNAHSDLLRASPLQKAGDLKTRSRSGMSSDETSGVSTDNAHSNTLRASSLQKAEDLKTRSRSGMSSDETSGVAKADKPDYTDGISPPLKEDPFTETILKFKFNEYKEMSHNQRNIQSSANVSSVVSDDVLTLDLIQRIRKELQKIRETFKNRTLRAYNRSSLPNELALLGKSVSMIVLVILPIAYNSLRMILIIFLLSIRLDYQLFGGVWIEQAVSNILVLNLY